MSFTILCSVVGEHPELRSGLMMKDGHGDVRHFVTRLEAARIAATAKASIGAFPDVEFEYSIEETEDAGTDIKMPTPAHDAFETEKLVGSPMLAFSNDQPSFDFWAMD